MGDLLGDNLRGPTRDLAHPEAEEVGDEAGALGPQLLQFVEEVCAACGELVLGRDAAHARPGGDLRLHFLCGCAVVVEHCVERLDDAHSAGAALEQLLNGGDFAQREGGLLLLLLRLLAAANGLQLRATLGREGHPEALGLLGGRGLRLPERVHLLGVAHLALLRAVHPEHVVARVAQRLQHLVPVRHARRRVVLRLEVCLAVGNGAAGAAEEGAARLRRRPRAHRAAVLQAGGGRAPTRRTGRA